MKLSVIIPAAGFSRRAPSGNKLLERLPGGGTVLQHVALLLAGLGERELIVVTGHQSAAVEESLRGLPLRCVHAEHHALGMGASLAAGVRACAADADGFLVCPGDLPWLQAQTVAAVRDAFVAGRGLSHVIPASGGRRGHPVVLGAWLRARLEALSGDEGARVLLAGDPERGRVLELCVSDEGIHRDVDGGLSRGGSPSP